MQALNDDFFTEWADNLPALTAQEQLSIDRLKQRYDYHRSDGLLLENTINLIMTAPLLELLGFLDPPFRLKFPYGIALELEDLDETIRGFIDVLIVQERLWILTVDSKRTSISVPAAFPQLLAYMAANPSRHRSRYGMATNGDEFIFLKLGTGMEYDISRSFSLFPRRHELGQVAQILKAVAMAKLSLWLVTLQKDRPFTFLDHALRCGDSLLGVTRREQIEFLHLNPDKKAVQLRTVSEVWRPLLAQAIAKRRELASFTVKDIQDVARKAVLQAAAEALTSQIKIASDYLIGEALAQAGKTGNLKAADLSVLSGLVLDALESPEARERERKLRQIREQAQRLLNAGKPEGQPDRVPFHWALEFPEVFLDDPHPLTPSPQGEGEPAAPVFPLSLGRGASLEAECDRPPESGIEGRDQR
ncbi:hypothetical protein [Trichothermofontia sp.]